MRNRVRGWLRKLNARYLAVAGLVLLAAFFMYFWHLPTLTPGLSPAESAARTNSKSLHSVLLNPVNLPHRLVQFTAQKAGYHGAFSMRFASVIFAIIFIGCLFWLMKAWFGLTIGAYGTLMFATTPLVVLLARNATAFIMLLSPSAVLAAYVWLTRREHKPGIPWLVLVIAGALSLYTPGAAWLFVAGVVIARKRLLALARLVGRKLLVFSLVIFVILLSPLVYALIKDVNIFHGLLLVPGQWLGAIATLKSIAWAGLALVWRSRTTDGLIIGRLPLLSVIQIALVVFGAYVMWDRARREMLALMTLIAAAIILAGANNQLAVLGLALPALALLSAAGLRYLYVEWRGVFPRNPLPLSFAVIVISSIVGLQVVYGLRYSLVAWPHTTATKQLYVLK